MIGILLCDLPAEPVLHAYGDYHDIFNNTFNIELVPFKVYKGELPLNLTDFSSFIITGASAYETKDWILKLIQFLRNVHDTTDIKIVGICFGFQILSLALGGQVVKNSLGWEVGPTVLEFKGSQLRIQSMHQDIVSELPRDWVNLASSDKCNAQFAVYKNRYLCLQGHPEYTKDMVEMIVSVRKHLWSTEFVDQVLETLEKEKVDSLYFVKMILDFVQSH